MVLELAGEHLAGLVQDEGDAVVRAQVALPEPVERARAAGIDALCVSIPDRKPGPLT